MTLTKKKMVREIGRRTRLTNREVQEVVETLVDVWIEALVAGEKIEIQNFLVLETKEVSLTPNIFPQSANDTLPRKSRILSLRTSKKLKRMIKLKQ